MTPEQLRMRSWWSGPELFLIVDDYDLVATSTANPMSPMADLVVQAPDIGLHVILTRRIGGAARAVDDPILRPMRDIGSQALILSGNKDEGPFWARGYTPGPLPPGRGMLFTRRDDWRMIQTSWLDRA